MYQAGQIIDRKEHVKFANWKNANGGNLISVSLGGGQQHKSRYAPRGNRATVAVGASKAMQHNLGLLLVKGQRIY